MTNRKSNNRNGILKNIRGVTDRLRKKQRRQERRLLNETLESRQLLAGPELIGIQPDASAVLANSSSLSTRTNAAPSVLNVAPSELTFQFDGNVSLDPDNFLDPESPVGIRISRAGDNSSFEAASVVSDLGTSEQVLFEFRARQTGEVGNGIRVEFTTADLNEAAGGLALSTNLDTRVVTVTIDSNTPQPATARALETAINNDADSSSLIEAIQVSGASLARVGETIPDGLSLTLTGVDGGTDTIVNPGFVGIGSTPHEVVFRFAEPLPDDTYQIEVFGRGEDALDNIQGEPFNDGVDFSTQFRVNVAPRVLAVIPEPVTRDTNGNLSRQSGKLEVYFEGDPVNATDTSLYQLIYTRNTATNLDDFTLTPRTVSFDPITNVATLDFGQAFSRVRDASNNLIPGAVRLRVGGVQRNADIPMDVTSTTSTAGDSFAAALPIPPSAINPASGQVKSAFLNGEIRTDDYDLQFPGGSDSQGVRNIRPDDPSRLDRTVPLDVWRSGADSEAGISTIYYSFPKDWNGDDPNLGTLLDDPDLEKNYVNLITEQQRQRVREVLSLYSQYLGAQFVEVSDLTGVPFDTTDPASRDRYLEIAVGDLQGINDAFNQTDRSEPGGVTIGTRPLDFLGQTLVGALPVDDINYLPDGRTPKNELLVMDFQDFNESVDDQVGGEFFRGAFLGVGQLLGYGYADHLPQPVTQSTASVLTPGDRNEPLFPSPSDIVNGQYLFRPESNDIDMYRFSLTTQATVDIQTFAERLPSSSTLNTALRLYQRQGNDEWVEIAANDDYFSNDSRIELLLQPNDYMIGVSASGNTSYDPIIPGTGIGGVTEGDYELRFIVEATSSRNIRDAAGNSLDGDLDGKPGGDFNYWFNPADPNTIRYVDGSISGSGTGGIGLSTPYQTIASALGDAVPGDTVHVVEGREYQVGFNPTSGGLLSDGSEIAVPQGVSLILGAGVDLEMSRSRIVVGSSTQDFDRSGATLQILGTPDSPVEIYGASNAAGAWGGIQFQGQFDLGLGRSSLEDQGIFLNHIQYADIRGGGGPILADGRQTVINPIDMAITRPTVINSTISQSANAAMAATPDTFLETTFDELRFQQEALINPTTPSRFTADFDRVGPHLRGNRLVDNSVNGLFIKLDTSAGQDLEKLNVAGRIDDADVVHVLTENLLIEGSVGGLDARVEGSRPNSVLTTAIPAPFAEGDIPLTDSAGESLRYLYQLTFVDRGGFESAPSSVIGGTAGVAPSADGAIRLLGLPSASPNDGFVGRFVYRATIDPTTGLPGAFRRVASLNSSDATHTDTLASGTVELVSGARRGRLNPSLVIDPGTVVKLDGARIDVTFGAHLYAEGTQQEPVVFAGLNDNRFGAGGTFNTNRFSANQVVTLPGSWGGIYAGFGSTISLDHALLTGGGGATRVEGGFGSFNVLEAHQSDLRVANSRLENNADGRSFINDPDDVRTGRVGRGDNASGVIFVRGAQPIIVGNEFVDNNGPIASFDVNSLTWQENLDHGRSTGRLDAFIQNGNSGPLIAENDIGNTRLNNPDPNDADNRNFSCHDPLGQNDIVDQNGDVIACSINGIEIRGGRVATETVWDDTSVVHVVRDTIEIPNQHIYGGLRIESDARNSLVVKLQSQGAIDNTHNDPTINLALLNEDQLNVRQAGFAVGGTLVTAEDEFIDIADRIGGSLQVVGQPDFPVVLTALVDDTVGAGFTADGRANIDTDNNGVRLDENGDPIQFDVGLTDFEIVPPGLQGVLGGEFDRTDTEINNGTIIDNDIDPNTIGAFEIPVGPAGGIGQIGGGGQVQVTFDPPNANQAQQQNFNFIWTSYVDIDRPLPFANPLPFRLADTVETLPQFVRDDFVRSTGRFVLPTGGPIPANYTGRFVFWTAETFILDNRGSAYSTIRFETSSGSFGDDSVSNIQIINYANHGVPATGADILYSVGTPGEEDFQAYMINTSPGTSFGFGHGGIYQNDSFNQNNATYDGWTGSTAGRLPAGIEAEDPFFMNFQVNGNIDTAAGGLQVQNNAGAFLPVDDPLQTVGTEVYGVEDVSTAFAWSLFNNSDDAQITTFVEFLPSNPQTPYEAALQTPIEGNGTWNGITVREASSDSNVLITAENESRNSGAPDINAIPGQSQFLGEIAPSNSEGDEQRRLGLIVDGEIAFKGDKDVYSFIGEAGSQIWLDIDRTNLRLDTVVELIDINGVVRVLSDDSIAEAAGRKSRLITDGSFEEGNARPLGSTNTVRGLEDSAYQDAYSVNPLDAGMRVILPGNTGEKFLYFVRVRSNSVQPGENNEPLLDPATVSSGLTQGAYQLQIRTKEEDVFAGTQIRYSDVRFAADGIQIIGGPMHGPLVADDYETALPNDQISQAQRLGLYDTQFVASYEADLADDGRSWFPLAAGTDSLALGPDGSITLSRDLAGTPRTPIVLDNPAGPLGSDRLAKNISGIISGEQDVDWYQFDVDYRQLTRDDAQLYLATVFDLDYSDNLARPDLAIYVFDSDGSLALIGGDSNVADDLSSGSGGIGSSDLSRGSFNSGDGGTLDPFIGSAELDEGTYFVAVANQNFVPQPLDQFFVEDPTNPLLRLEPIDSVRRIAEERFNLTEGGTADGPVVPVLFDDNSIVDYTFDDVLLYVNTTTGLHLVNPFTGANYGFVGNFLDANVDSESINDVAFRANGELFGYSTFGDTPPADDAFEYYRIDSSNATLSAPISVGAGIETFHDLEVEQDAVQILDEDSNDGIEVEAISIRAFNGAETGFLVANRPTDQQGLAYFENILYAFDDETGLINGTTFDRALADAGAGTAPREIGQIDTVAPVDARPLQLGFTAATEINAAGIAVPSIVDGDRFTLTNLSETVNFEFNQGPTVVVDAFTGTVNAGDLVTVSIPGITPTVFEFTFDSAQVSGTNKPVVIAPSLGPEAIASQLAAAVRREGLAVSAAGTQVAFPTANSVTVTALTPATSSLSVQGDTELNDPDSIEILLLPTDTSAVIAERIVQAVTLANSLGQLPGVDAAIDGNAANPRSVRILGGFIGDPLASPASLPSNNLVAGGVPTGGQVTGVELVGGDLYAVTDAGGLFFVDGGVLGLGTGNQQVGQYVLTSTDLIGLNFEGLRAGPNSVQDGELSQILFGITSNGTIHAFNTLGELQPVFAGGRTSITTGIGNARGLDFSTLDYSLWHTTGRRGGDLGHGIEDLYHDARLPDVLADDQTEIRELGGNSLAFHFENNTAFRSNYSSFAEAPVQSINNVIANPRDDGTNVNVTYNFPGGARGEVQSNSFDLEGYASGDQPTLYFTYFLETDGIDSDDQTSTNPDDDVFDEDRDALRVYIVDEFGVEHLVATNNQARTLGTDGDEFDDPDPTFFTLYDDNIDVDVQQLYDNTGTWRQARVPLDPFAGQAGLSMRIEFSSAGTTNTGTPSLRTVSGDVLVENAQLVINGEVFSIDLAPAVSTPSGEQLATAYEDPAALAVVTVDGQDYVLNDGTRTLSPEQISVELLAPQPPGTTLDDLSAVDIANLLADTVDLKRIVPSGAELALVYADPTAVVVIPFAGTEYVLNDGTRPVGIEQVSVNLTAPGSLVTLDQLSEQDIADALATEAGLPPRQFTTIQDVPFSDGTDTGGVSRNDLIFEATSLDYSGGNATFVGNGRIGTTDNLGNTTQANDVDLLVVNVTQGTDIFVQAAYDDPSVINPLARPTLRLFDRDGNTLPAAVDAVTGDLEFQATYNGLVYIGISGGGNDGYDPRVAGSASAGLPGIYTASVQLSQELAVQTEGNLVEVVGANSITTQGDGLFTISGQDELTGQPIRVSRFDSAPVVAQSTSQSIADRFTGGNTQFIPVSGASIRLGNLLTVDDYGPFVNNGLRYGDAFGGSFVGGASANDSEGVYIDDIVIGFAERGEAVTGSVGIAVDDPTTPEDETGNVPFVSDGRLDFTVPAQTSSNTDTGSYQLEIRDASEYVDSLSELQFRTFDTNDRLADSISLQTLAGAEIVDGTTFTISNADASLTFEYDIVDEFGLSDGLSGFNTLRIPIELDNTAVEVADAVVTRLSDVDIQDALNIEVGRSSGSTTVGDLSADDSRINIFGDVGVTTSSTSSPFAVVEAGQLRGDANRDRLEQGVIVVENSRFVFSEHTGIDITRDASTRVLGDDIFDTTPNILPYPRNLLELNTEELIPGVVVRNNILGFNSDAGLRISGLRDRVDPDQDNDQLLDGNLAISNPIGFDRIVNNTLVGGFIEEGPILGQQVFGGISFEQGGLSFADDILTDNSLSLGIDVDSRFSDIEASLSIPDCFGIGPEPDHPNNEVQVGQFSLSLGSGGTATLVFDDNLLTNNGTSDPDLVIFEVGTPEPVRVEISSDGETYIFVGIAEGGTSLIDIDPFVVDGSKYAFVRLTDLSPRGSFQAGAAGADIDAVGAISSTPANLYSPGSEGIFIRQNAAPTLLNNIVANFQTGIAVQDRTDEADVSADLSVIGATTYYANANDAKNDLIQTLGLFPQRVNEFQELFTDPANLQFTPEFGAVTIDSSIDSLEDRASLATLRGSIGLPPRPVLAPRLDSSGQLRVDDPLFEFPSGFGSNPFKDRGASERAEQDGPRAVLVSPRGEELPASGGTTVTMQSPNQAFEIQLVDGIAPAELAPGIGVDDASVKSDLLKITLLRTFDSTVHTLVEGVDYSFAYEPADNTIRLTPISGLWETDATYRIEYLDPSKGDVVLVGQRGSTMGDGDVNRVAGQSVEVEKGITVSILDELDIRRPINPNTVLDGQQITIFDGTNVYTFEIETGPNTTPNPDDPTLFVRVPSSATSEQLSRIIVREINRSPAEVLAVYLAPDDLTSDRNVGRFQLFGLSENAIESAAIIADGSADVRQSIFRHTNRTLDVQLNTQVIEDPANPGTLLTNFDGQRITVFDGEREVTFEYDTDNQRQLVVDPADPAANPVPILPVSDVLVPVGNDASTRELVDALFTEIRNIGMNVDLIGAAGNFRISGTDRPISVTSPDGAITVSGLSEIGVTPGFGLQIPTILNVGFDGVTTRTVDPSLAEGQTFTIIQNQQPLATFEFDSDGELLDDGNVPIALPFGSQDLDPATLAQSIIDTIATTVPGVTPSYVGAGKIVPWG